MDAQREQEYLACLALRHSPGLGPRTWKKILSAYPSAREALAEAVQWPARKLANLSQVREFQSGVWRAKADGEARAALERNMDVLLWFDPWYPEFLRQIPGPPVCLYFLGDSTLLQSPCLAVVGSRRCSRYGLEAARTICQEVSRAGMCIVSGFASGIDRQAHLAALEEVGSSIAVLGTGLDLVYPAANKDLWLLLGDRGLIITEFAPGTRPDARNFPHRNRIISGLALGVLVIEAAVRSGSLITATSALEQGREVFALPGPVNLASYEGCHHLIRQGAMLVQSARDILAELHPLLASQGVAVPSGVAVQPVKTDLLVPGRRWPELAGDDLRLVEALHGQGRVHIDTLCQALKREAGEVSRRLLMLEMRSIVTQLPGMYYQLES